MTNGGVCCDGVVWSRTIASRDSAVQSGAAGPIHDVDVVFVSSPLQYHTYNA